jgi:hypothetical protein
MFEYDREVRRAEEDLAARSRIHGGVVDASLRALHLFHDDLICWAGFSGISRTEKWLASQSALNLVGTRNRNPRLL